MKVFRYALFWSLGLVGMLCIPQFTKQIFTVDLLPDGMMYLLSTRFIYSLFIGLLAIALIRDLSRLIALSSILMISVVAPFIMATATLALMAYETWRHVVIETAIKMIVELSVFALVPISMWLLIQSRRVGAKSAEGESI